MTEKVLGFTGHRPSSLPWRYNEMDANCVKLKTIMEREVLRLIQEKNVTRALSGMALGVDTYGAEIILKQKEYYPSLQLECVLPYEAQAEKWNEEQRERYFIMIGKCDKETMIQKNYSKDCYLKRNTYIAQQSHILIAVSKGKGVRSGTEQTIRLATEMKKHIIVIDPVTFEIKEINKSPFQVVNGGK